MRMFVIRHLTLLGFICDALKVDNSSIGLTLHTGSAPQRITFSFDCEYCDLLKDTLKRRVAHLESGVLMNCHDMKMR